jgi:hypothetical protein
MPHRLYDWRTRVRAALREYHAVRIGVDLLSEATADDIHSLAEARGWDDLAASEIYSADNHLEATYIIRIYSVFERAVSSFWNVISGDEDRDPINGDELLDKVGLAQRIDEDVIQGAQQVRIHRNNLVHGRIDVHAAMMTIEDANRDLLTYLDRLPATWG